MLRRIFAALRTPSLEDLHARDLEEARRNLREAILAGEAWESREVLYRSRIERLLKEPLCATTSKSKDASSDAGPLVGWESHFAALTAGSNGLGYGDLSRDSGYERTRAEAAAPRGTVSELQAVSSPVRASFLKGLGKKP